MFHVSHLVHRSLILSHMQCFYLEKRRYFQFSISFYKIFSATFSLYKIAPLLKEPFFLRQGSFNDPARGGLGTFNQGARLGSSNLAQLFLRPERSPAQKNHFFGLNMKFFFLSIVGQKSSLLYHLKRCWSDSKSQKAGPPIVATAFVKFCVRTHDLIKILGQSA